MATRMENMKHETEGSTAPVGEARPPVIAAVRRSSAGRHDDWRLLTVFDFYRLLLAAALALGLPYLPRIEALQVHLSYLVTTGVYALGAALSLFLIHLRWPDFRLQVVLRWVVDLTALGLLLTYAGGVGSGLEILLVAEVAALAFLLPGRAALGAAASAALLLLVITQWLGPHPPAVYYQAALAGTSLFAVAFLGGALGRRLRTSEALAEQRAQDLVDLAQLNDYVIQRIDAGILVVDPQGRIRLMNEAAWYLYGNPVRRGQGFPLVELDPVLATQLDAWRADPEHALPRAITRPGGERTLRPRFALLGNDGRLGVLIFLEDVSAVRRHAQALKLASMGRLATSIAHEVRNPLGAISHAAQLLEESPHLNDADRRLLAIIRQQAQRMNAIVENVLELSRRGRAEPRALALETWVLQFVEEFRRTHPQAEVRIGIDPPDTQVWMDPGHLRQVMTNLCENAVRHGATPSGKVILEIRGGRTRESKGPFLEVVDRGPGVDPRDVPHLFEPFYTTETRGTGLGLYVARELCEASQAYLEYVPVPAGGSCFRITFRDPQRKGV